LAQAGRLIPRQFKLILNYNAEGEKKKKETKVLKAQARVCTAVINIPVLELNLGDCNIGHEKVLYDFFFRSSISFL
jgi:hypothetical protein